MVYYIVVDAVMRNWLCTCPSYHDVTSMWDCDWVGSSIMKLNIFWSILPPSFGCFVTVVYLFILTWICLGGTIVTIVECSGV